MSDYEHPSGAAQQQPQAQQGQQAQQYYAPQGQRVKVKHWQCCRCGEHGNTDGDSYCTICFEQKCVYCINYSTYRYVS